VTDLYVRNCGCMIRRNGKITRCRIHSRRGPMVRVVLNMLLVFICAAVFVWWALEVMS